jgi:hypothetical protein
MSQMRSASKSDERAGQRPFTALVVASPKRLFLVLVSPIRVPRTRCSVAVPSARIGVGPAPRP